MYYIVEQNIINSLRETRNRSMINLANHFEQGNPDIFEVYYQIEPYAKRRNQKELTELFLRNSRWFEKSALILE